MTTSFSFFDTLKEDLPTKKDRPQPPAEIAGSQFFEKCKKVSPPVEAPARSREIAPAEKAIKRSKSEFEFSFRFDDPSTHNAVSDAEIEEIAVTRAAPRRRNSQFSDGPSYWERKKALEELAIQDEPIISQRTDEGNTDYADGGQDANVTSDEEVPPLVEDLASDEQSFEEQVYKEDENGAVDFGLSDIAPLHASPFTPTKTMKLAVPANFLSIGRDDIWEEASVEENDAESPVTTPEMKAEEEAPKATPMPAHGILEESFENAMGKIKRVATLPSKY